MSTVEELVSAICDSPNFYDDHLKVAKSKTSKRK